MSFVTPDTQLVESLMREALQKGQEVQCRVYSGSMRPAFKIGDLLVVDGKLPQVGEVAVYVHGEYWVTHRVIKVERETFFLRGDAIEGDSLEEIPKSQIIGRVVEHRRDRRAREITAFRWALRLFPNILKKPLKRLLPRQFYNYINEKSLKKKMTVSSKRSD